MKRLIGLLLTVLLLVGCSTAASNGDGVRFFYPREMFSYTGSRQNIVPETRELSTRENGIFYLLSLYLLGPTEEGLSAPFPKGTMVLSVSVDGTALTVQLSDEATSLSDSRFTLGCACLAMTCMQQSAIRSVTVQAGDRNLTLSAQDLTLYDYAADAAQSSED